jgi:hypothetical protein
MNAAIYAGKSTEQIGVAEETKSVTRQVENANLRVNSERRLVRPALRRDCVASAGKHACLAEAA